MVKVKGALLGKTMKAMKIFSMATKVDVVITTVIRPVAGFKDRVPKEMAKELAEVLTPENSATEVKMLWEGVQLGTGNWTVIEVEYLETR